MDLNLLTPFITVAEASSFSAAAAKLGLKRSSVSRAVAALEQALDVQLFSRTTRQVALTTAGAALYAKLKPQLSDLRETLGSLAEGEEQPSGVLRVTVPNDLGTVVLSRLWAGFSLRYPRVQLDARLENRLVDLVSEGIDVALRVAQRRLQDSTLVAKKLSEIELQVYAAPNYLARAGTPRTPADAARHDWVFFRGARLLAQFPPLLRPPAVVGDDMLFVLEAVRAGAGLGMLPTFLAQPELAAGGLLRVLPRVSALAGTLYLVHPAARRLPRKVTAFREYLLEQLSLHPLVGR